MRWQLSVHSWVILVSIHATCCCSAPGIARNKRRSCCQTRGGGPSVPEATCFVPLRSSWLRAENSVTPSRPCSLTHQIRSEVLTASLPSSVQTDDETFSATSITTRARLPSISQSKSSSCATLSPSSPLGRLAQAVADCLKQSDGRRDDGFDGASTGWTSWVDQESAAQLQQCVDSLGLRRTPFMVPPSPPSISTREHGRGLVTDIPEDVSPDPSLNYALWMRWLKNSPTPVVLDYSRQLRRAVQAAVGSSPERYNMLTASTEGEEEGDEQEFLSRIGCSLIVLPSGETLSHPLQTPPGGMIYGKLLLGGVIRFRLLGNTAAGRAPAQDGPAALRRVGERRVILPPYLPHLERPVVTEPGWLQYGGPQRNYQAVDMGPGILMEMTLLPRGVAFSSGHRDHGNSDPSESVVAEVLSNGLPSEMMTIHHPCWPLEELLDHILPSGSPSLSPRVDQTASGVMGHGNIDSLDNSGGNIARVVQDSMKQSIGGLGPQVDEIVRRVLDGRVFRPMSLTNEAAFVGIQRGSTIEPNSENARTDGATQQSSDELDQERRREMLALQDLGLQPVRGLLLHGPPGCGKTALAREISKLLRARPAKIVAAPELLDRWVGGSERLVRELFADAETELAQCQGDATLSSLHVIVIDEMDAVFRRRSSGASDSSGEVTRASAVNQILAKLDGVQALGNVLLIGMTNRKELLDPALLRPGRLEVQIRIPPPDQEGRREILQILFGPLRRTGRLSQPLCRAIDGTNSRMAGGSRGPFGLFSSRQPRRQKIVDLASDRWTGGFTGADLAGLVRCAGSFALARSRLDFSESGVGFIITLEDVYNAIQDVKR